MLGFCWSIFNGEEATTSNSKFPENLVRLVGTA